MELKNKGKIVRKICWTETLRNLEVNQIIEADLTERINVVRHITRISKEDNKKFSTRKISQVKMEVKRVH